MSEHPWDILGIEPTRDELAIRRAYARMLKRYRPDEDPEGFASLVKAREQALRWCLLDDHDDLLVAEGEPVEASANEAETTVSSERAGTDASQDSSSNNPGAAVGLADADRFDAQTQAAAFAAALGRLRELIHGVGEKQPRPIWDAGKWCAALAGMSELAFEPRRLLREFIVREALPTLPVLHSVAASMKDMRGDLGPGSVVAVWENEFSIVQDQSALARLCGAQAMLRYLAWFALVQRAWPLRKCSEAERHVIDRLAALLPPCHQRKWDGALPKDAWALQSWEELSGLIRQLTSAERARCRVFLADRLMAWLPVAPAGTLSDLRAGIGPALVVEAIEREFGLLDGRGASKDWSEPLSTVWGLALVDLADVARYKDWFEYAQQLRKLEQRLVQGEAAYRDQNGIPVIPAEDIALGALSDASAIELVEAQRSGRWRLNLDASRFHLTPGYIASRISPLLAIALVGIEIAAIPLLLMLGTMASGMYPVAVILVILVACRVFLACMLDRLAAEAAAWRVRRADRAGVVAHERRRRMVAIRGFFGASGNFIATMELPLLFMVYIAVASSFRMLPFSY